MAKTVPAVPERSHVAALPTPRLVPVGAAVTCPGPACSQAVVPRRDDVSDAALAPPPTLARLDAPATPAPALSRQLTHERVPASVLEQMRNASVAKRADPQSEDATVTQDEIERLLASG